MQPVAVPVAPKKGKRPDRTGLLNTNRLHKDLLISHSFLHQIGRSWAHFKPIQNPPRIESLLSAVSFLLKFMLHIQSSLSAARTREWTCAAFRSDPIRGKNPFRITPRSSNPLRIHWDISRSLRIDSTKIHWYLTHFSMDLDDLGVILELILPRIKAPLYAAQITLLFTLQIESLLSATFF